MAAAENDGATAVTVDDLLRVIGLKEVTISTQARTIGAQAMRIAELEQAVASLTDPRNQQAGDPLAGTEEIDPLVLEEQHRG